jgi:MSHA biogenesis protein MshJ
MKALWSRYLAWFAALNGREQRIIAFAVLVGGLFLGYTYGIEPSLLRMQRDAKTIADAGVATNLATQQTALLNTVNVDPDAPLRERLAKLKADGQAQGSRFAEVERSLVAAEKMPALLESLLARGNALQLVSMRTLPPTPLIDRKPAAADVGGSPAPGAPNLFKHGVEIKVAGGYNDLLAYVRALEAAPQRLLWGRMELGNVEYPRAQLTLTVYTLSLEKSWLVL